MNISFEWNEAKNKENLKKHGVSFQTAQYTFLDLKRVIAQDLAHSQTEKRYYCFGKVKGGVLTVRFTYRGSCIRIIGAGYWRKGRDKFMKNKIKYTDEPIQARVINDFLPSPEELSLNEKKTKVTLTLTQKSLDFFKKEAKQHGASYQAMIRRLLDYYVVNQRNKQP